MEKIIIKYKKIIAEIFYFIGYFFIKIGQRIDSIVEYDLTIEGNKKDYGK